MAQKQFDDHFFRLDLSGHPPKASLVPVRGRPDRQLIAKALDNFFSETNNGCLVHLALILHQAKQGMYFLLGDSLHTDEQTTTVAFTARPLLDAGVQRFPAAKIEIAHAKVRMIS